MAAKSKKQTPKTPHDDVIDGEVIASEVIAGEVSEAETVLGAVTMKKRGPIGLVFAIIIALAAFALAGYGFFDNERRAKRNESLLQAQITGLQEQVAKDGAQAAERMAERMAERLIAPLQDKLEIQAAEIATLSQALGVIDSDIASLTARTNNTAPVANGAALLAMMMWQDMKAGKPLDDYEPFLASLSDRAIAETLLSIIADWQALDYPALLEQGRGLVTGASPSVSAAPSAAQEAEPGVLAVVAGWASSLVKIQPLSPPQSTAPAHNPAKPDVPSVIALGGADKMGLDALLSATNTQDNQAILAWRQLALQVVEQRNQLSRLIIRLLADEVILP